MFAMVINALGSSGTITGKGVGQISDEFPTLITPAGYAFSIWGVIYTFLAIFVVYQLVKYKSMNKKLIFEDIKYTFSANMVLNAAWILVFCFGTPVSMGFSVILIAAILVTILMIHH